MASLSGQNIKDTFQKLVQVDDNGRLQNGIGGDLGQVTITGSIAASSGFVGSLQGNADTSTLATTATSASFATTSSLARLATTASNAQTASLAQTAISASNATTASFTVTASFAITSSNALQFAGKDVAQFITSGSEGTSQYISGSLRITQNLDVLGTASFQYVTASQTVVDQNTISVYASGSILPTAGYVVVDTASVYSGSSFLYNVVDEIWTLDRPLSASLQGTASYALTASNLSTLATASYALTASLSTTASNALTASYLDIYATASYALTASYLSGSINVDTGSLLITASLSGSLLEFTKGDGTTFTLDLPAGGTASGSSRVFEFTSASLQWDMTHNFDQQHVSVTLYNENHLQIGASQISASDANNVSAYFTYPVAGYAMVLAAGSTTTVSGSNIETGSLATTGSNVFIGDQLITGSVDITGSLFLNGVSLTAGTVESASYSETASYINTLQQDVTITGSAQISGSLFVNGVEITSGTQSGGGATVTISGSAPADEAPSGSLWWNDNTGNLFIQVNTPTGSTYVPAVTNVITSYTASYATTASYAESTSFASTASFVLSSSYALSSSLAASSSFATSASYALSSSYAVTSSQATTASFVVTASHTTMNEWIAAGTCSISATTTNPTKGTIVQDNVRYRKVNATTWEVEYKYAQSTVGNAGSGTYVFALPSGIAFGASVIQSTSATLSVLQNSAIPATATQAWDGPSIRPLMVVPRTSTSFQLVTLNGNFSSAIVSSANSDWVAGTTFMLRFYVDTN